MLKPLPPRHALDLAGTDKLNAVAVHLRTQGSEPDADVVAGLQAYQIDAAGASVPSCAIANGEKELTLPQTKFATVSSVVVTSTQPPSS